MNKKIFPFLILVVVIAAVILIKSRPKTDSQETTKEVKPRIGTISNIVSTTAAVLPKNRLEIKPPVNGRIESILVKEGDKVKIGQVIALMSSTERAALIDAARAKGEKELKYWQEVYRPIELLAPIDAEVIVATTQVGQTVTTQDAVIVLSDYLIVRAEIDETDIGKVKLGQKAEISIDAYPDVKIGAQVEHIYFESKTVNNVTIYEVDLIPEEIPDFFRSGMNAEVSFITEIHNNILIIPLESLHKDKDGDFVFLKKYSDKEPVKQFVKIGIYNDKDAEVLSGLSEDDVIIVTIKKIDSSKKNSTASPFSPFGARRR
ncbi:MAG: efflux RND transporter periplasmic adaptor subunit [Candidatus Omnitrophota bacterium]